MIGVAVVGIVAAVIVAATVATARAIHNAPILEDEPSTLDLWDNPDRKDTDQ